MYGGSVLQLHVERRARAEPHVMSMNCVWCGSGRVCRHGAGVGVCTVTVREWEGVRSDTGLWGHFLCCYHWISGYGISVVIGDLATVCLLTSDNGHMTIDVWRFVWPVIEG